MTRPNATARMIHTLVIGGAFAGAVLAASISAANAMQIFNCTNQSIPVSVTHTPTGEHFGSADVAPGQGMAWHTGLGAGYQVDLHSHRVVKQYGNRQGDEILSIAIVDGKKQLLNGYKCGPTTRSARARPQPVPPKTDAVIKGALAAAAIGIILHNATK